MKRFSFSIFILLFTSFQTELSAKEKRPFAYTKHASIASPVKMEKEVFDLINEKRRENALPPLTWSESIAIEARHHSLNMANKRVPFGHQGSDQRFKTLQKLISFSRSFAENVAYNSGYSNPVEIAVLGWLESPGHYKAIMGDFNLTGVGVEKNLKGEYYFTQLFVKIIPNPSSNYLNKSSCSH